MSRGDCVEGVRSPSRRRFLRAATAVGVASTVGGGRTAAASAQETDGGDERWRFDPFGRVGGSPTVVDGTAFVGTDEGSLYALDAATGDEEWRYEAGPPLLGAVTVVDGVAVVGTNGDVLAVDAATGKQQWRFDSREVGRSRSSPTVASVAGGSSDGSGGSTCFVGAGQTVYAVDAESAREEWQFATDGTVHSSPTVAEIADEAGDPSDTTDVETLFVGSDDGHLYALDAAAGEERWRFQTGDAVRSSATVAGGAVGAGASADGSGSTAFVGSLDGSLYAIDAATGEEVWQFQTGDGVIATPTVSDGVVFVGSDDGHLYALDAATGEERWRFQTGDRVRSSPTVAGAAGDAGDSPSSGSGTAFVGSDDGHLYALDAETGEEAWRAEVGPSAVSSPTVVDVSGAAGGSSSSTGSATVFVGSTDGALYALDAGTSGSSEGSRAWLGTLGHHDEWAHADQSIDVAESDGVPGMGLPATVGGLAGAGYLLARRRTDESGDA